MERLTLRSKNGLAFFDNDGVLIRGANGTFHQKKDMTGQYIHDRFVALDKAIDRLANYEDTGLELGEIETLLAEREAAGWISVEDKYPKKDGAYLVTEPNVGVYIAYITKQNGNYFWWANSLTPRDGVTHWMLLPTPPDVQQTESTESEENEF